MLGAALLIARNLYLNSVPTSTLQPDAAAAAFDILVRFIKTALRALLVAGLVVAAGAFFTGPSVPSASPSTTAPAAAATTSSTTAAPPSGTSSPGSSRRTA